MKCRVAIDVDVEVIKAPEGEGKWCGGCLGTSVGSRLLKLWCCRIAGAKSRGQLRASASRLREGASGALGKCR